jgi:hypothetical protein
MLTAAASNPRETCWRARKSAGRLAEKPLFVEALRSTLRCPCNFSGYFALQLSGRSARPPITAN